MARNPGLHQVSETDLVRLLQAVARDQLPSPITRASLLLAQFAGIEMHLDALVGLPKQTSIAILSAVLRERRERREAAAHTVSAVWDGPAATGVRGARDLMLEWVATVERSLWFTGADLDRDRGLLRSLEAAQQGRSLELHVVLRALPLPASADPLFRDSPLRSRIYYPDPERVHGELPMCLLVDDQRGLLLAGSAPDPEAHDNQVTVGIAIEHSEAVLALQAQWTALVDIGALIPLSALSG